MTLFCGIDWAETHHDVAIIDNDGQLIAKKRIPDDPDGFAQLIEMLAAAGDNTNSPVPVAIETPRGLLVAALRATGRPVYAINPLAVARYRERQSVARSKSDHADAMTLANIGSYLPNTCPLPAGKQAGEVFHSGRQPRALIAPLPLGEGIKNPSPQRRASGTSIMLAVRQLPAAAARVDKVPGVG